MERLLNVALLLLAATHAQGQLQYGGYYRYAVPPQNNQHTMQRYPYNAQQQQQQNAQNRRGGQQRNNMQPQPGGVTMYPYGPGPVIPQGRRPYGTQYAAGDSNAANVPKTAANVLVNIQLSMYSNPNRWVTGGMQCYDDNNIPPPPPVPTRRRKRQNVPASRVNSAGDSPNNCQLIFVTTVTTPGDPPASISTMWPFHLTSMQKSFNLRVPPYGAQGQTTWTSARPFHFKQKPTGISVVVLHTGVLRWRNNTWNYGPGPWTVVVDSFLFNMTDMQAVTGQQSAAAMKERQLVGSDIGTTLSMSASFSCLNDAMGPNCDLHCNLTTSSGPYLCKSFVTGRPAVCLTGSATQPQWARDCTNCELGAFTDSDGVLGCRQIADGFVKNMTIGVDYGWRTAAIILMVALGIVVILALCCCIAIYFGLVRRNKREPADEGQGGFDQQRRPVWSNWAYNRAPNDDNARAAAPREPLKPAVVPGRTTVQNGHVPNPAMQRQPVQQTNPHQQHRAPPPQHTAGQLNPANRNAPQQQQQHHMHRPANMPPMVGQQRTDRASPSASNDAASDTSYARREAAV